MNNLTYDDYKDEIWMFINGYPNYMVSNCGRVKSLNYRGNGKEHILTPSLNKGYLTVILYNSSHRNLKLIHRLVASVFIENPELKPQVNHKNGNKTDNRVVNLEWCTSKENINHAWSTGLNETLRNSISGENNGMNKLSDFECETIRLKYSTGNITQKDLAEEYGCSQGHISVLISNKQRSNRRKT